MARETGQPLVRVEKESDGKRKQDEQKVGSLFVENISEKMHWKGLWHSFARHGDVVDAYIARKLSRGRRRFGFVRMNGQEEAERAIKRLHGFRLFGSKLMVKPTRGAPVKQNWFGARSRVNTEETKNNDWKWNLNQVPMRRGVLNENNQQNSLVKKEQKRMKGHVEEEDLWKMRKCLVGEMETVCSVSSIHDRLENWGLGEIEVQRMGAKTFLLTIDDDDLYLLLEDLKWSYLNEIFWGAVTLLELGDVKKDCRALGVNVDHKRDCEKLSILITTTQIKKIEEVIELEVGEKIVEVGVVELGFLESTAVVENRKPKADFGCNKGTNKDESTSDSSSEQAKMGTAEVDRCCSDTEEEALNAMWAEKENNNSVNRDLEKSRGLFNEEELIGGKSKETNANGVIVGNQKGGLTPREDTEHDIVTGERSWAEMVRKGLESGNGHIEKVVGPNRNVPPIVEIMANTTAIGVQVSGPNPIVQPRSNSWVAVLDENYNRGVSLVDEDVSFLKPIVKGKLQDFILVSLTRSNASREKRKIENMGLY
ncbi:hypothetical protein V6N13_087883 [Hibiscus sabdariffa]